MRRLGRVGGRERGGYGQRGKHGGGYHGRGGHGIVPDGTAFESIVLGGRVHPGYRAI